MRLGKVIGEVVAAPIKIAVDLPQTMADMVEEVAKAIDPKEPRK